MGGTYFERARALFTLIETVKYCQNTHIWTYRKCTCPQGQPAITKNVQKFTALWTLMLMWRWRGSHMLEPVFVAAAVVMVHTMVRQEVLLVVRIHLVTVADVGRWSCWGLVHVLLFLIGVGGEVNEPRWGTTWSTPGP